MFAIFFERCHAHMRMKWKKSISEQSISALSFWTVPLTNNVTPLPHCLREKKREKKEREAPAVRLRNGAAAWSAA